MPSSCALCCAVFFSELSYFLFFNFCGDAAVVVDIIVYDGEEKKKKINVYLTKFKFNHTCFVANLGCGTRFRLPLDNLSWTISASALFSHRLPFGKSCSSCLVDIRYMTTCIKSFDDQTPYHTQVPTVVCAQWRYDANWMNLSLHITERAHHFQYIDMF